LLLCISLSVQALIINFLPEMERKIIMGPSKKPSIYVSITDQLLSRSQIIQNALDLCFPLLHVCLCMHASYEKGMSNIYVCYTRRKKQTIRRIGLDLLDTTGFNLERPPWKSWKASHWRLLNREWRWFQVQWSHNWGCHYWPCFFLSFFTISCLSSTMWSARLLKP